MEAGKIRMTLDRKYLNGLCSVLTLFAENNDLNGYEDFANYMLAKIKKYGRKYTNKNSKDKLVVYLYNNEAELLIQLMAICVTASVGEREDYYAQIGTIDETELSRQLAERERKLREVFS